MDDFKEKEYYEEELERRSFWKRVLIRIGTVLTALIVLAAVFYIYGGLRQLWFYSETPPAVSQIPTEVKIDKETLDAPLSIIVLRNEKNGSKRSREDIESLVENASKVWDQGAVDFTISEVKEVKVSDSEINSFFNSTGKFIRKIRSKNPEGINVILIRRLRGINGIAFPGMDTLAVADLTSVYDFRVLAHEVGHILGLGHVSGESRLMHREANGFELTVEEIKKAREELNSSPQA